MLIEGSIAGNKTDLLIEKYVQLINSGVSSSEILVIVQNSSLKNKFVEKALNSINILSAEKLRVHSFFSLVYNTIADNWAFLEDRNIFENPVILPNMSGLEVSQFIFKNILRNVKFKGYNSRRSLLHQIFRRYSLIIQNNLSQSEINERAKILKEGFSNEADYAIKQFLKETLKYRAFDYLRQHLLFNFIYKNTNYFNNIKYLIVDDADELTPICMDFISYISKNLKENFIAIDPLGSSRCGYLSADKNNFTKLKTIFGSDILKANDNTKILSRGLKIFNNVKSDKKNILPDFYNFSFSKRSSMIYDTVKKINELLDNGINPNDISVITPVIDDMLRCYLRDNIKYNVDCLFISGSEKLIQNKLIQAAIVILKLNTNLKITLSEFDIRILLSVFLEIPLKYCEDILENFNKKKELLPYKFEDYEYTQKYENLIALVNELSATKDKISNQLVKIYQKLFCLIKPNFDEINKYNFFVKQITDFEDVFGDEFNTHKEDIIIQFQNSIISENPYSVLEIAINNLVISTPQKIIDNHINTKFQFWLDITNSEWIKSDTGPLYNAWVFQKDWDKKDYTVEDNISMSKDKIARVLRKLCLNASADIYCYSSLFDSNGIENFGALEDYIITKEINSTSSDAPKEFRFIPRKDQKPVLEYKNGYMGISAVPGAGKTTILLALIIKLLDDGISPENIFVLTYMDSAARNFRQRIKSIQTKTAKLPNISTIHGLSLRILKENGNHEKLGLSEDFEICDDSQKGRILKEIAQKMKIDNKTAEEFDAGISVLKMNYTKNNTNTTDKKIKKFLKYYELYQQKLKEYNLIDYDDMLTGAVKILKENVDILNHYQNICHYIIEDEAQDSSKVQQDLITLLSGKHKNVIRCGDVNQSITSTFSNADVKGFRNFITQNYNVSMNCSQRCTKDVWELANNLVKYSIDDIDSKNSFFEMYMQPVEGKNPTNNNKDSAVKAYLFENSKDEKIFILKTLKETLSKHPDYTIGILLRKNYQVTHWQELIENSGLKVITRTQCLEQKSVFRTIFAVMKMILEPFNNEVIAQGYKILSELGFYNRGYHSEISKYENPFIRLNVDNLGNTDLEQFYWDLNYWVSLCTLLPYEIAIKVGEQFFRSEIERANIYLICTLIKRICVNNCSLEYAINRLSELSKKPNLSGFKFFSEEDEDDKAFLKGKIQIMTMHKSKGDEFDLTIIPEMTENNFPLTVDAISVKSGNFLESVKRLNPNYKPKSEYLLKQELLEENTRLLYVAITRAKRKLIFSAASKYKNFYGKEKSSDISIIYEQLLNYEKKEGHHD